ncbi:zinc-finger of mitochondrial splicing suppressor 51-domain-containing protein [Sordaria sp. MPI-SDFR-AT-0083]|nr:zinc-finger of mitochondrial splicing suppressor 51-domain-containing protein [Sordaria sp. MPI-SDFR-AT-0083]
MALPADRAVRPALSKLCSQCSSFTARQSRQSAAFLQSAQQRSVSSIRGAQSSSSSSRQAGGITTTVSRPTQTSITNKLPSVVSQSRSKASSSTSFATNEDLATCDFECPDCGIPVYCSEQHWMDDYEKHLEICDTLRQINEDDHDLHSGRHFYEFNYAGPQMDDAMVNMTNWDTFMYTRQFEAVNDDRCMRQATKLLTYPLTIGSILHELSPYHIRNRLTVEGLKSLTALRYTLHPPKTGGNESIKGLRPEAPPVRLFILGARAESSLPRDAWVQLAHLFPRSRFHLIFIGPESMMNRDDEFPLPPRTPSNPYGAVVEDRVWPTMKISTIVDYYHTIHKTGYFAPHDPYFDAFTKAPIIATGYTQADMERDVEWVNKKAKGEFDILMEPGENIFRSLRWDLNDLDPQDISAGNWGVWAFRGKRYEATVKDDGVIAV